MFCLYKLINTQYARKYTLSIIKITLTCFTYDYAVKDKILQKHNTFNFYSLLLGKNSIYLQISFEWTEHENKRKNKKKNQIANSAIADMAHYRVRY